MAVSVHAAALMRIGSLPVPSAVYDVSAGWFVDGDGQHHARRHQVGDTFVHVTGTLGEFLGGSRCNTERCAEWVHALGDDVIVAAQIAVAVTEAWDVLQSFTSGTRTANRVESIQAVTAPFDRAETITGTHPLVDRYREVMVDAYADQLDGYIVDLRQARVQIVAAAVDHIARTERGVFDEVDRLIGANASTAKPTSRGDLVVLRNRVGSMRPTQVSQLASLQLTDLGNHGEEISVIAAVTVAWRAAVVDAVDAALIALRGVDEEFAALPEQLAGVSERDRGTSLPYRLSDIAHAFAWRPNACLAILPAALARVIAPDAGWQMVDLEGQIPEDEVLEVCEALWDTMSGTYGDLEQAYRAARTV